MKKYTIILFSILLCLSLLLTGCMPKIGVSDIMSPFLREAGVSESEIREYKVMEERAREQAEQELEQLRDDTQKMLSVLTDEVGELIAGNADAYAFFAKAYTMTHLPVHYTMLDSKAVYGYYTPDKGKYPRIRSSNNSIRYLCDITEGVDNTGTLTKWYEHGSKKDHKNPFSVGQCTWYCFGRFWEDNGIYMDKEGPMGSAKDWRTGVRDWLKEKYRKDHPDSDPSLYTEVLGSLNAGVFVVDGAEKIYPHSIAVGASTGSPEHGHVIYIEDVKYEDGVPVLVYFSEANFDGTSNALDKCDGGLKSMPYEDFLNWRTIYGYIVPMNMFNPLK